MSKTFGIVGGGGGGIKLASIEITTPPEKTTYTVGETFDPAGMVVKATYSNGATAIATGYAYTPSTALTAGITSVTIQYTEAGVTKTVEQAITVSKAAGSLFISPDSLTLDNANPTGEIIVDRAGDGAISAVSSAPDIVSVSVSGNVVTVTGLARGSAVITISVAEGTNHTAPASKTCAVTVSFTKIYGVQWDGTSATTWSRTDAAETFVNPSPAVNNGSGSSPFDSCMPWSGMVMESDSTAGVLVKIPKYYYKWTRSGSTMKLQIADGPEDGFLVSPAHADRGDGSGERDYVYVGRYHCISGYKSSAGAQPQTNITRATARTNIHNLGSTYWQYDFAMYWTIMMLYLVEYADWNSQKVIGYGCSPSGSKFNTGATDAMSYHTGTSAANRTTYGSVQYRYIEGLWDNVYDWCDGIYFSGSTVYCIKNPASFSDSSGGTNVGTRATFSNYISGWTNPTASGFEYALYPNALSGSKSTYVCDYCYYNSFGVVLLVGGSYDQGQGRGAFCLFGDYAASDSVASIGFRLQKLP